MKAITILSVSTLFMSTVSNARFISPEEYAIRKEGAEIMAEVIFKDIHKHIRTDKSLPSDRVFETEMDAYLSILQPNQRGNFSSFFKGIFKDAV